MNARPLPEEARFVGYRRRIAIMPAAGRVTVDLEDDFHRFGVIVHHDGSIVEEVAVQSPRHPWTTCPAAGDFLAARMQGAALAKAAHIDNQRNHCTHIYDLFVLGAAHALTGEAMVYDIRVSDADDRGRLAELFANGKPVLRWMQGGAKDGDMPGGTFRDLESWSRSLPADMQEAARMLRRGVMVAAGRGVDFAVGKTARDAGLDRGVCYSFQPERAGEAVRVADSVRDFSADPDRLLRDRP